MDTFHLIVAMSMVTIAECTTDYERCCDDVDCEILTNSFCEVYMGSGMTDCYVKTNGSTTATATSTTEAATTTMSTTTTSPTGNTSFMIVFGPMLPAPTESYNMKPGICRCNSGFIFRNTSSGLRCIPENETRCCYEDDCEILTNAFCDMSMGHLSDCARWTKNPSEQTVPATTTTTTTKTTAHAATAETTTYSGGWFTGIVFGAVFGATSPPENDIVKPGICRCKSGYVFDHSNTGSRCIPENETRCCYEDDCEILTNAFCDMSMGHLSDCARWTKNPSEQTVPATTTTTTTKTTTKTTAHAATAETTTYSGGWFTGIVFWPVFGATSPPENDIVKPGICRCKSGYVFDHSNTGSRCIPENETRCCYEDDCEILTNAFCDMSMGHLSDCARWTKSPSEQTVPATTTTKTTTKTTAYAATAETTTYSGGWFTGIVFGAVFFPTSPPENDIVKSGICRCKSGYVFDHSNTGLRCIPDLVKVGVSKNHSSGIPETVYNDSCCNDVDCGVESFCNKSLIPNKQDCTLNRNQQLQTTTSLDPFTEGNSFTVGNIPNLSGNVYSGHCQCNYGYVLNSSDYGPSCISESEVLKNQVSLQVECYELECNSTTTGCISQHMKDKTREPKMCSQQAMCKTEIEINGDLVLERTGCSNVCTPEDSYQRLVTCCHEPQCNANQNYEGRLFNTGSSPTTYALVDIILLQAVALLCGCFNLYW